MAAKKNTDAGLTKSEAANACAVLSYLIIGIIWYFADEDMKKSSLARHHAKQALVLLISWIIAAIAITLLGAIFSLAFFLNVVLVPLAAAFGLVVSVVFFVLWVIGIVYAATSQEKELPIIGRLGKNFKF